MAGGRGCGCCYSSTSKRDQSGAFCTVRVCDRDVDKSMATPLRTGAVRQSKTKTPTCELYLSLEIRKILSRKLSPDNCRSKKLNVWLTRATFSLSLALLSVSHAMCILLVIKWPEFFTAYVKMHRIDPLDRTRASIRDVAESSFHIANVFVLFRSLPVTITLSCNIVRQRNTE